MSNPEENPPVLPYTTPARWRRWLKPFSVAGITFIGHLTLTTLIVVITLVDESSDLFTGRPAWFDEVMDWGVAVILFPCRLALDAVGWDLRGPWILAWLLLNSLLWSAVAEVIASLWPRRRSG